jgi:hypothetical protein
MMVWIMLKGIMFAPATGKSRSGMRMALGDLGEEILRDGKWGENSSTAVKRHVVWYWGLEYVSISPCVFRSMAYGTAG